MDSLLANYGSDDEEDERANGGSVNEEEELKTQHRHLGRAPLSASLPPPRVERDRPSDVPSHGSALFASLPRPKFANEGTTDLRSAVFKNPLNTAREHKETQSNFKMGIQRDGMSEFEKQGSDAEIAAMIASSRVGNATSSTSRVSLFSALPPPRNADPSAAPAPLTSQGASGPSSKRVVEIRPTINWAMLQESNDDDDEERHAKRLATESVADGKLTGLAAILPKPKYLGSALGSGSATGHQTTLDVETTPASQLTVSDSDLANVSVLHCQHSLPDIGDAGTTLSSNLQDRSSFTPHSINEFSQASRGNFTVATNLHNQPGPIQLNPISSSHLDTSAQERADVHYFENEFSPLDTHSQEMAGPEMTAQDALAEMLLREKRKGGRNAPVNIIEVKQADLTASKLREDQLRTTGIAFGPAYKPLSTGKNKPSKLHRRKHQIGSLFYDMKQKEGELMERRAKGYMTKSETQAKYGW